MTLVYLALGSNLGDRHRLLQDAIQAMGAWPETRVVAQSRAWDTEPVGGPEGQPVFLNQVVSVETGLEPLDLLARTQGLEQAAGRLPVGERVKDGPRTLDIDILLWGEARLDLPGLTVPHPRMVERVFVMGPLADIAPDLVVPGESEAVSGLLRKLESVG